jgi:hypothetical protein
MNSCKYLILRNEKRRTGQRNLSLIRIDAPNTDPIETALTDVKSKMEDLKKELLSLIGISS